MTNKDVELNTHYNIIIRDCFLLWGKNLFTPIKNEKRPEYYQVSLAVHDKNSGMDEIRSIHKKYTNKYQSQMSKYSVYKAFSRDKQNRLRQYFDIVDDKLTADPWTQDLLNSRNLTTRIDDYNALSLSSFSRDFFVTSLDDLGKVIEHSTQPTPDIYNAGALVDISFYLYYYESKEYNIGDSSKSRLAIRSRCELESIHLTSKGLSELYKELPSTSPTAGMHFDKQRRFVADEPVEFEIHLNDDAI